MLKYPELERGSIEVGSESMFESWSPYFTGYQMPQANAASMMLTFSDKDERNDPERITLRKYCKWCRRHTGHRETR